MIFIYTVGGIGLFVGVIVLFLYAQFYWCRSSLSSRFPGDVTGENLTIVQADAYFERGCFFHKRCMFEKAVSNYDAALTLNPSHALVEMYKKYALSQKIISASVLKGEEQGDGDILEGNDHFASVLKRQDECVNVECSCSNDRMEAVLLDHEETGRDLEENGTLKTMDSSSEKISIDLHMEEEDDYCEISLEEEQNLILFVDDPPKSSRDTFVPGDISHIPEESNVFENNGDSCSYCQQGKNFLQQGLFAEAIAAYKNAIEENPHSIDALLGRASVLLKTGAVEDAVGDYDKVIALDPRHIAARNKRGNIFLHLNELNAAIDAYTVSLAIDPRQVKCLVLRGTAYFRQELFDDAIKDFSRAIVIDPLCREAYNDRGEAYKRLGQQDKAQVDFQKAEMLVESGDSGEVESQATPLEISLAIQFPTGLEEVFAQGMKELEDNHDSKALLTFNRVINDAPDHPDAYVQRGNINLKYKEYNKAIADYSKAIEIVPSLGIAYLRRGETKIFNNLYLDGIDDFDRSIELMPDNSEAYLHRGMANSQRAQRDDAIRDFSKAIEIDAESDAACFNRGKEWQNLGEYDKALLDFERACTLGNNAACIACLNLKDGS